MFTKFRKAMLATSVSVAALMPLSAMAQEAIFVLGTNEVGVPSYNLLTAVNTNTVYSMLYDNLVAQDNDQSFHPYLAESWEEAPDGMAWTFHLKAGV